MSLVSVTKSKLDAIADAIRAKTGGQSTMTLDDMPTEIANIPSGGGGLPSGYTQIDYLESDGTQYIDTGVTATQYSAIFVDFAYTSTSGNQLMGFNSYPNNCCFGIADGKFSVIWGSNSNWTRVQNSADTNRHLWGCAPFGSMGFLDNSTPNISRGNNFTTGNMYLFVMRNPNQSSGVQGFCSCKIYSAQLYDKYTKVRDFVPCIRNSDSVAGMYDIINGQFYTNAGTGTFITP